MAIDVCDWDWDPYHNLKGCTTRIDHLLKENSYLHALSNVLKGNYHEDMTQSMEDICLNFHVYRTYITCVNFQIQMAHTYIK